MKPWFADWAPLAVVVGGYLLGIFFNLRGLELVSKRIDDVNKRLDDLRGDINRRFDESSREMDRRFDEMDRRFVESDREMDRRFNEQRDYIRSEIRRLEDRAERPLIRP